MIAKFKLKSITKLESLKSRTTLDILKQKMFDRSISKTNMYYNYNFKSAFLLEALSKPTSYCVILKRTNLSNADLSHKFRNFNITWITVPGFKTLGYLSTVQKFDWLTEILSSGLISVAILQNFSDYQNFLCECFELEKLGINDSSYAEVLFTQESGLFINFSNIKTYNEIRSIYTNSKTKESILLEFSSNIANHIRSIELTVVQQIPVGYHFNFSLFPLDINLR